MTYGLGGDSFRVQLGDDQDSSDGLRHPPANFSIGVDRGFFVLFGAAKFLSTVSQL